MSSRQHSSTVKKEDGAQP